MAEPTSAANHTGSQGAAKPASVAVGRPAAPGTGPARVNGAPTAPPANQSGEVRGEPTAPIEPSIWKKYSPHHEFPLSLLTTIVLYMFAGLVIAVFGVVSIYFGSGEMPEIENIEFAGGGGDPSGSRDSNVNYGPQENIDFRLDDEISDAPVVETQPDLTAPTEARERLVEEVKRTNQPFRGPNSFGRGGTGTGGGKGSGHGTGEGDGSGPGKQTKREKRKDRWFVTFPFRSGEDYLRHVAKLGAYIAYPEGEGKFRLFEDLNKRPLMGRVGTVADIKKWNRIYWRDTNPDAIYALASALNLSSPPPYFWIFFPVELENLLFEKEKAYRGLTEEQIIQRNLETHFEVDRVGDKYEVRVIKQERKSR